MASGRIPRRRKVLYSAATLVVLALLMVAAEIVARQLTPDLPGSLPDPFVGRSGAYPVYQVCRQQGGRQTLCTTPNKRESYRHVSFTMPKPPGTLRVFFLGGSSVWGFGGAERETMPVKLQAALLAGLPGARVQVINSGGQGASSSNLLPLARAVLAYQPDLLVLYSGHNEWTGLHWNHQGQQSELMQAARMQLHRLRLVMLWGVAMQRFLGWIDPPPPGGPGHPRPRAPVAPVLPSVTPTQVTQAVERFERHLHQLISAAQARGVPVVLSTVASNLQRPPVGCPAGSAEPACAAFARGERLLREGDLTGAARALREARQLDPRPMRARDEFNRVVLQLGARLKVPVADTAAAVKRAAPQGIPGDALFSDHLHPTARGNEIIARRIAEVVLAKGLLKAPGAAAPPAGGK